MDMMCGDCLVHYRGWAIAISWQEPARILVGGESESSAGGLDQSWRVHAAAKAKGIRHLSGSY
jgi:hypothetical protein